jgi:hypothetical protein
MENKVLTLSELLGYDKSYGGVVTQIMELKFIREVSVFAKVRGIELDISNLTFSEDVLKSPYAVQLGFIDGEITKKIPTLLEPTDDRNKYFPTLSSFGYEINLGVDIPRVSLSSVLLLTAFARYVVLNYLEGLSKRLIVNMNATPAEYDYFHLGALYYYTSLPFLKSYMDKFLLVKAPVGKENFFDSFPWFCLKTELELLNTGRNVTERKKQELEKINIGDIMFLLSRNVVTTYADKITSFQLCRVERKSFGSITLRIFPHPDWACTKSYLSAEEFFEEDYTTLSLNHRPESFDIYNLGIDSAVASTDSKVLLPASRLQDGTFQILREDVTNRNIIVFMDLAQSVRGFLESWGLSDLPVNIPSVEPFYNVVGYVGNNPKDQMWEYLQNYKNSGIFKAYDL